MSIDASFNFSSKISDSKQQTEAKTSATTYRMSVKVLHNEGTETKKIFQKKIKAAGGNEAEAVAQRDNKRMEKKAPRHYVPISSRELPSRNAKDLKKAEILYVKISDLRLLGFEQAHIDKIITAASAPNVNVAAIKVREEVKNWLIFEQCAEKQRVSLKEKWNKELEPPTREKLNKFTTAEAPRITGFDELQKNESYINGRASGSATISSSAENKKIENWLAADEFLRAHKNKPITAETLSEVNKILQRDTPDFNKPGVFRSDGGSENVRAGKGYVAPYYLSAQHVEKEVHELIEWVNTKIVACHEDKANPIEVAALFYQRLVSIHPFHDANGRTCRLLMDHILERFDLPAPALGMDVAHGMFGNQFMYATTPILMEQANQQIANGSTPDKVVASVMEGMRKSYQILGK